MSNKTPKEKKHLISKIKKTRKHHVFMALGAKIRAYFFTGILVTAILPQVSGGAKKERQK